MAVEQRIRDLENTTAGLAQRVIYLESHDAAQWDQMRRYEEQHSEQLDELKEKLQTDHTTLLHAIYANKIAWSSMNTGTRVLAWIILALLGVAGLAVGFFDQIKRFFTGS